MMRFSPFPHAVTVVATVSLCPLWAQANEDSVGTAAAHIGREIAVAQHLADGEEFRIALWRLLDHGKLLFEAQWTSQEGGLRPLTKGNGNPVTDPTSPLVFLRAFNRISAMDANSCAGCHSTPFGIIGGGGDYATGVFVLGQRFDFATFDHSDMMNMRGARQENGQPTLLQNVANFRVSLGMLGSGYIEMLAREITADLQATRNTLQPGQSAVLRSKNLAFGRLARRADGTWDTAQVEGLPAPSLATTGAAAPPSLVIRPFHQAGNVVSLRQFTNNAFNHHHGIQPTERFGRDTDPDGDAFRNEMTRADVTAVSLFQATLAVPGRVIPDHPSIEAAIRLGERRFRDIGCATCHVPELPLNDAVFTEPNPYNPAGNLQVGQAPTYAVDLNRSDVLPPPRLQRRRGVTMVPAFTDLKLHDICTGPSDPNGEPLDMQQAAGSAGFFAGNRKFITRKLWGTANEPPYFHHGQFTTLREAIVNHDGEARSQKLAYQALPGAEQDAIVEFLKSLRVLPAGTRHLVVNEHGQPKHW